MNGDIQLPRLSVTFAVILAIRAGLDHLLFYHATASLRVDMVVARAGK